MKALITGGCGFIGSAVCREAIKRPDWSIVNVDAMTYAATTGSTAGLAGSGRYRFVQANILDRAAIQEILNYEQPDLIMHLAAESHVDRSIDNPISFVETNVLGTANLLDAACRYHSMLPDARAAQFRFHHISTDEVFGSLDLDDQKFSETTPYDPSSPYSASKAAADHIVRAYHRSFGLPVVLTNCSNNYGPFHFPEKLIPLMIIKALRMEPLPVYGSGKNIRDWLYVEDHAEALLAVATKGNVGDSYNIGGNAERTNLEVVEAICDILDSRLRDGGNRRSLISFVADRPGHDMRYAIDATKVHGAIGWQPRVTFEQGLQSTIDWFLKNEWWWKPIMDGGKYSGQRIGQPVVRNQ
jgi:dTDP-glucose 4,6-dehydratase